MKLENKLLTTDEAAKYIGYSTGTLENWRATKIGPPFHKPFGKVFYYQEDLDKWVRGTND